ncbi:MAG: cell division protein FtsB [Pontibacterium sp.]
MLRWFSIIVICLLLALQYRLWFGDSNLPSLWQLEAQVAEQKSENAKLQERNARLEAEIKDLKSGLSALEERARNELGMIREGETFYQLVDPTTETSK